MTHQELEVQRKNPYQKESPTPSPKSKIVGPLQQLPFATTQGAWPVGFFFFFAACVLPLRKHWVTSPFAGAQIVQSLKKTDITLTNTAPNNSNNNSSENSQGSNFSVKYTISALIFKGNAWKHNPNQVIWWRNLEDWEEKF